MLKKKTIVISLIAVFFIITFFIIGFERTANSPKYQKRFTGFLFKTFMVLPDSIKSSIMILSGKKSFSNLFNDYNIKFLPETQYIELKFDRKTNNLEKKNRNTFYIDTFEDRLLFVTISSEFYETKFDDLKKKGEKLKYKKISVNGLSSVKGKIFDILISDDQIFVSKGSIYKDCKRLEIYVSKISDKLDFKIFKSFAECISIGSGTCRIKDFNFNGQEGILITTQDADNDKPGLKPQDDESIFGKTVFIDKKTKEHQIFSKGHRNAQGLFIKNDIILSTEHGPRGGDEINKIEYKKNYGWPIVSYGDSYKSTNLKYLKSHKENGFQEPIYAFVPSIGISELIILPNSFNPKWKFNALVTSLNGRSIYRVKFEDESFQKIIYVEKIFIGERIRDIKYVDKLNFIIVALERTGDIGIIKNK
jgi:hypothetical protein